MNVQEFRKFLKKKKLTAFELGRLYIADCLNTHATNQHVFTEEEANALTSKVDKIETKEAQAYIEFHTWIHRYHAIVESYFQQLYVGYSRLFYRIHQTLIIEEGLNDLDKLTKNKKNAEPDYQELKKLTKNILFEASLFAYMDSQDDINFVKLGLDQVKIGLIEVFSYNKALELFTNFFKIPELSQILKKDTVNLCRAIEGLNGKVTLLKSLLSGSAKEVKKKNQFLDELYPIINLADYKPTIESIKKAKTSLKMHILENNSLQIIKILKKCDDYK